MFLFWDNVNKKIFELKPEFIGMPEIKILQMFLTNPDEFKKIVEKEIEVKEETKRRTLKELIIQWDASKLKDFFDWLYFNANEVIYLSPHTLKYPDRELLTFLVKKAEDENYYYKLRSFNVRDVFFPFDNILRHEQEKALLTNVAFDEAMFKMIILNEEFGKIKIDYSWYYNLIFQVLKTTSETLGFFVKNLIEFDYFVNSCCYQIFPFRISFAIFEGNLYRINKEKRNYNFVIEFKLDSSGNISETKLFVFDKINNRFITEGSCHPNAWSSSKFCWGNVTKPAYVTKDFVFSMVSSINFDSIATKIDEIRVEFKDFYKKIFKKMLKQG